MQRVAHVNDPTAGGLDMFVGVTAWPRVVWGDSLAEGCVG